MGQIVFLISLLVELVHASSIDSVELTRSSLLSSTQPLLLESTPNLLTCTGSELSTCVTMYTEAFSMPALTRSHEYLNDTLDACKLVGSVAAQACKLLTRFSLNVFQLGYSTMHACSFHRSCKLFEIHPKIVTWWNNLIETYYHTPIGRYLAPMQDRVVSVLNDASSFNSSLPDMFHTVDRLSMLLCDEIRTFVYETSRFMIMSHAGMMSIEGDLPWFRFSKSLGSRWEIALDLLQESGIESPLVVEIGVFRGFFSEGILKGHSSVSLIGVDPYFGSDGTFPPEHADAEGDSVYEEALDRYKGFENRAKLLRSTSYEASLLIPDGSVEMVFIDGCHELDCITEDLDIWIPKVRSGGIVMGHDYSEKWPAVMMVVNQKRIGQELYIGSDLTWWFFND